MHIPSGDDSCAHRLSGARGPLEQHRAWPIALETGSGLAGDDVVHLLKDTSIRNRADSQRETRDGVGGVMPSTSAYCIP